MEMKIAIGSDHAGFELKQNIVSFLQKHGQQVQDFGTHSMDSCDYPDFAKTVAAAVQKDSGTIGILVCGTGIGMSMTANRFSGIRAALCHSPELAKLSREHNNANVLCLGSRTVSLSDAQKIVQTFLDMPFSNEERHQRRVQKID